MRRISFAIPGIITVSLAALLFFAPRLPILAVDCNPSASGSLNITTDCTFSGSYNGVDTGTGNTNAANLKIQSGILTVNPGQVIAVGSLSLTAGSVALNGILKIGQPVWGIDADNDGYPINTTWFIGPTPSPGMIRRNLMNSMTVTDCNDNDATKWQNLTGYQDSDNDNYTTGGAQQICSGASLPSGWKASANGTDCNDSNASIYPGTSGGSTCTVCNANGTITNQPSGQDLGSQCSGTYTCSGFTTRLKNTCNGSGACADVDAAASDCSGTCASYCSSDSCISTDTGAGTCTVATNARVASGGNGHCTSGTCVADCTANGGACSADATCCSGICGTDADNDGYFSSALGHTGTCQATSKPYTDCNDSNVNIYQNVASLVTDADQDGYTTDTAGTQCVGGTTSVGGRTYYKNSSGSYTWLSSSSSLGTDCNDANASLYQNLTCYGGADADGDGFRAGSATSVCSGASCPSGYSAQQDCYDSNANAKPGQTSYFVTNRGDGSFDYNCNGTADKYPFKNCLTTYPIQSCGTCDNTKHGGWVTTIPACGGTATIRYKICADSTACTSGANPGCTTNSCPGYGYGVACWAANETGYYMTCN